MHWMFVLCVSLALGVGGLASPSLAHLVEPDPPDDPIVDANDARVLCEDGEADGFPCANVDLLSFFPVAGLGATQANDIWGWTDPETGIEYAIIGLKNGTAFLDLADPTDPIYLGKLPTRTRTSTWRDIKVDGNYAFIVSEARSHGMQVFDLTRLRSVESPPVVFGSDADHLRVWTAHNIAINEETDYAYVTGTSDCNGGLHILDIADPLAPIFAGCFSEDGYTHDTQCVLYRGPDVDHWGREICFNSNIDTLTIVDVTEKPAPFIVSKTKYEGSRYAHQGWLTEDQSYFLLDDELDETRDHVQTRTYVFDVSDLDAPHVAGWHEADSTAIDHNLYIRGKHVFQANYRSGIRILRLGDLSQGELGEIAYFDTIPWDDLPSFSGTWSVYPYFASGVIIASDMFQGLFVLDPDLGAISECEDGIDNDGDGLRDHPEDPACISEDAVSESLRSDVEIDLLTRWRSHRINLADANSIRIAVRGSETVDVRDIDPTLLRFGPNRAAPLPRKHSGYSGFGSHLRDGAGLAQLRDTDRDGHLDLAVRFDLEESGLEPGDDLACLAGELRGDEFQACDRVEIVYEECRTGRGGRHERWGFPWRLPRGCFGQEPRVDWRASRLRHGIVRWLVMNTLPRDYVHRGPWLLARP